MIRRYLRGQGYGKTKQGQEPQSGEKGWQKNGAGDGTSDRASRHKGNSPCGIPLERPGKLPFSRTLSHGFSVQGLILPEAYSRQEHQKNGAGDGTRTHDVQLGKLAFYH